MENKKKYNKNIKSSLQLRHSINSKKKLIKKS